MPDLLALKNVADLLQLKPYRISYVLPVKLVPEPCESAEAGFSQDDVTRLDAHFGVKLDPSTQRYETFPYPVPVHRTTKSPACPVDAFFAEVLRNANKH